jgi:hypothetical protein
MVQITDVNGTNIAEVDPTLKALRVTQRPMECLGWYSFGLKTGGATNLVAGSTMLSVQYTGSNYLAVRRVGMGAITTVYVNPGVTDYGLYIARSFTVNDTGGSNVSIGGNNNKHRTSLLAISAGNVKVATNSNITIGTRTLDTEPIGSTSYWQSAAGSIIIPALDNLFAHNEGDYPLILATNEGFVVNTINAQPTSSNVVCYFNFEIAEVTVF